MTLPTDAAARKAVPLATGVLDYFPDALAAVAECSKAGNDQHNPGQPLHHNRAKSGDEADALLRHLMDRGTVDTDGIRHSAKVAWRALALLQKELEAAGAPLARGARDGLSVRLDVDGYIHAFAKEAEPSALDRYLISGAVQEDANFAARVGQPETPTVEFEADPVLQALIERSDEEAPLEGLTAGKAHMAEFGANPVSQRDEE